MEAGPDVVDVLVDDHQRIDGLLVEAALEQDATLDVCIAELARHLVVEEQYLYPVVQETLPRGERLAADGLARTQEAERLMKQLERAMPAEREPLLARLHDVLRAHVQETEDELFPALRHQLAPDQLGHLAGVVELAKRSAPTHPHPGDPHTTPWNQILTPVVGLVDRVRDTVTGRLNSAEEL